MLDIIPTTVESVECVDPATGCVYHVTVNSEGMQECRQISPDGTVSHISDWHQIPVSILPKLLSLTQRLTRPYRDPPDPFLWHRWRGTRLDSCADCAELTQ